MNRMTHQTRTGQPLPRSVRRGAATALLVALACAGGLAGTRPATAAPVGVGLGSYNTTLPAGQSGPPATIYKTANVSGPMPTNDWWSSLAFKTYPTHASENMFADPLALLAKGSGLGISYPTNVTITPDGRQYEYQYAEDLTLGTAGLNTAPTNVKVDGFSEWTVTADWAGGALKATFGHGLPFVYATKGAADALIVFSAPPTIRSNSNGVVQAAVNGHEYGIYGPSGAAWTVSGNTLQSSLAGKNYFSVAVLPDSSAVTFNDYKAHAYAFVTNTAVSWNYDTAGATMVATYSATTTVKEGMETRPLLALYRHQWLNGAATNTAYSYSSPHGQMKVLRGTSFSTNMKFQGVLPAMPDKGTYNRTTLYNYVNDIYSGSHLIPGPNGETDTYWTGKSLGRLAMLVPIADQVGHTAARDAFLADLKAKLQDWFSAPDGKTSNMFYYDSNWGTLIGYPSNYGANNSLNDHHFHYGYYVMAAAIVSMYDPTWAAPNNWGGMVEMLIKDPANWSTANDPRFPRLRNFDPYAGHAWASGDAAFAAGNNEESSSESLNFSTACILWGTSTGNMAVRDMGIYLYTTEVAAVEQYWFDINNAVHPNTNYTHNVAGMVWGDGASYSTWFSAEPEMIQGINYLPITGGSLYLGRNPSFVTSTYNELVANNGGPENDWKDVIWSFQALADPAAAISKFGSGAYTPEDGETKAHTYHWLHNLNALGRVDLTVTANVPTYAVFNKGGVKTYVAYNASSSALTVNFSDGATLAVPARAEAAGPGTGGPAPTATSTVPPAVTFTPTRTPTRTLTATPTSPPGATATPTRTPTNTPTHTPSATNTPTATAGSSRNAYSQIEAESYSSQSGTQLEACSDVGGGQDVGWIANGDYLVYNNINFGANGPINVTARVASGVAGGVSGLVEFWVDGLNGTKLGDFALANTGGWQTWQSVPANTLGITGTHTLYIKFTSGQPADYVNVNWVQFLSR